MLLVSGVIPFRPRRARGKVRSGKLALSHAVSAWGPNLDKSWIFFIFVVAMVVCLGHLRSKGCFHVWDFFLEGFQPAG